MNVQLMALIIQLYIYFCFFYLTWIFIVTDRWNEGWWSSPNESKTLAAFKGFSCSPKEI